MKVFVTGGSGFIGRRLIEKLIEQGNDVWAIAHAPSSQQLIQTLGATPVSGSVIDSDSMRPAMEGADVVFHLAAETESSLTNWQHMEMTNVVGTRTVLELAHELGVPRIVYTGSTSIFGDTSGNLVDETHEAPHAPTTQLERTKWLAYYDVVQPLIKKGVPIICVLPGTVYGPDDQGFVGQLMRRFYLRQPPFPFLLGPDTVVTFSHINDIVDGHLLAAEKGQIGESYILAGPAVSIGEMVDFWARLTGKRPPLFHVPSAMARPVAPISGLVNQLISLPKLLSEETLAKLGQTTIVSAEKAVKELGWRPRSLQAGMLDTFAHIAGDVAENPQPVSRERQLATVALIGAVVALTIWLWSRPRSSE